MTTPASHGPSGSGLTPPPAFDDGDAFDDLGVDGDAYLASLLDKAGGDLAAESRAALEDPDALAALVAKREAEESTAAEVDSLKASIAEKARRVLDHPSSPARVHNKTGVLGRELADAATSLAEDARALEVPTTSPMSEARKAAEREKLAAALARRRDASAKYGRVDPADKRRWPSKRENERRLRELEDARKSYERRYPPAKIDAGGGLRLPARVDAQPEPPKAKENRVPAATAVSKPRPWRHNALASYDKNDQISVSFDDTRRLKTLKTNRRVYGTKPTRKNDAGHKDGWRVDREKYPSFKNWLSERKADLVDEKRKNEELAAKMRERAEREKEIRARLREQKAGDGSDPAPAAVDVPVTSVDNPALSNFLAMCDEFAKGEDGLEEFVSDPAWRAAATKAIEAKAVEAAKEAAKAAVAAKERMIEDRLMTQKIVAEEERMDVEALRAQVFADPGSVPEPRGPVETVMDGDVVLKKTDVEADVHGDDDDEEDEKNAEDMEAEEDDEEAPPDPAIVSKEQLIANALAAMSADERIAARAAACKGWTADFSGTFFKGTGTVSKKGPAHPSKTPTWCEKPRPRTTSHDANDREDVKLDVADLAVEFIGPNAADLAYAALHPNSDAPVAPKPTERRRSDVVTTAEEAVARGLVAKPGEPGFDMAKVKEVLECEFMGAAGDHMALQAVFPDSKDPAAPAPRDKYMKKKKVVQGKALKMHAERIEAGEFALQTGVPQLAVEFIGANAKELTAEAIAGYLDPQSATENLVGVAGADEPTADAAEILPDETMDEEEYAEFIAADPVQGAVDLPDPRPPLLLADLFAAENEDTAGEYDDEVQDDFEEFAAEAETIETSRRNSENAGGASMTSPADPPAVTLPVTLPDDHSDDPVVTDDAVEDALAKYSISMDSTKYSPIKQDDGTLDAVRRLVNEGSADGSAMEPTTDGGAMDTDALKAAADAMARGDVVPPEAISDAARAMGVPGFGADWRETGRAAETAAAGGGGGDANPWSGGGTAGEEVPSTEEVLREGEVVAARVDAAVAGGDVPDVDDARALLDGVKDRVGVAFNK